MLQRHPAQQRQILKKVLTGPLMFTARKGYYEFDGEVSFSTLLAEVAFPILVASPMPASWNQIVPWLRRIDGLRRAA